MEGSTISVWGFLFLQDAADSVKLWNITKGVVVEDYGKVSLELLGFFFFEFLILLYVHPEIICFYVCRYHLKRRKKNYSKW